MSNIDLAYQGIAMNGIATNGGGYNIGVRGEASGSPQNYSIDGFLPFTSTGWAGYFDGNVFANGTYTTSDEKLKTNVASYNTALVSLNKLHVKTYNFLQDDVYKTLNLATEPQIGIMAQDLEKVYPQLVRKAVSQVMDEKKHQPSGQTIEFKAVNYTGLIPLLVQGMQEQQKQIEELKAEVAELKALIKK